jgi:hypothetical protein
MPSADQNDALMAAYLAWSTRHQRKSVELIGSPVVTDDSGTLREGAILHCRATLLREPLLADPVLTSSLAGGVYSDDDWNEEDALRLRFTDTGLVHGNTPENMWLKTGRDYLCETQPPHSIQEFRLHHTSKFTGGRGWTCVPTIPDLLARLGRPTAAPISKAEPVRLRIRIVTDR